MNEQMAHYDLVVIGGGPGGYTAGFRAADLGLRVAIIEKTPLLGGTCLHVGCIPSKTLLHAIAVKDEVASYLGKGLVGEVPQIDVDRLRERKEGVVSKLAKGLGNLAKQRRVKIYQGQGHFESDHVIAIKTSQASISIGFDSALIATGSSVMSIPGFPDDSRIMDSTEALALEGVPEHMVIVGGGIIGLEMAMVYHGLGSAITLVEMQSVMLPFLDRDIYRPLERRLKRLCKKMFTGARVESVCCGEEQLELVINQDGKMTDLSADRVLVAAGRVPNSKDLNLELLGVETDQGGHIVINDKGQTRHKSIYAIGDVTGQPMLAHRAVHQGRQVAEVIAGKRDVVKIGEIPSVLYTDPEIAWVGETEVSLSEQGAGCQAGIFPWGANGRSLSQGRNDGVTKIVCDPQTGKVLGGQIVGPHAGELISEVALAIEMGADHKAIAHTVHPHPTLCESIAMAAEDVLGEATDLPPKVRK